MTAHTPSCWDSKPSVEKRIEGSTLWDIALSKLECCDSHEIEINSCAKAAIQKVIAATAGAPAARGRWAVYQSVREMK